MNLHAMLALQQGNAERIQQDNSSGPRQNGFMQAFAQASGKSVSQATASGSTSRAPQTASSESIEQRLKALGLSEEQLQRADMQALIADINEQPALLKALEALAAALSAQAENGFANISSAALLGETDTRVKAALASTAPSISSEQGALQEITQRLALVAMYGAPDTSANAPAKIVGDESGPLSERVMTLLSGIAAAQQGGSKGGNGSLGEHLVALSALRNNSTEAMPLSQTTQGSDNMMPQSKISGETLLSALLTTPQGRSSYSELSPALPQGLNVQGGLSSQVTQGNIPVPLTSAAWPRELGQQVAPLVQRGGEQQIKLNIHPADLGPLSVSLKMGEQGAQAHFLSAHAQVRQVLEMASPQLREALAEQGINLADTSVGEQRQQEGGDSALANGSGNPSGDDAVSGDSEAQGDAASPRQILTLDGRVDLYA